MQRVFKVLLRRLHAIRMWCNTMERLIICRPSRRGQGLSGHVTSRQDVTASRCGQGGRHVTGAAVDKEDVTPHHVRTSQALPWTRRLSRHVRKWGAVVDKDAVAVFSVFFAFCWRLLFLKFLHFSCSLILVFFCNTKYYSCSTLYYKVGLQLHKELLQYYNVLLQYYFVSPWSTKYYSSTTRYYKELQYYSALQNTIQYYPVLQSTSPVLLCTTKHYKVLLQSYSVLQSTTPVLLFTTKHYKVLLQYYSVLQRTTTVLVCTWKYYSSTTK